MIEKIKNTTLRRFVIIIAAPVAYAVVVPVHISLCAYQGVKDGWKDFKGLHHAIKKCWKKRG